MTFPVPRAPKKRAVTPVSVLPTVEEISAGGVIVDFDKPSLPVAIIARINRGGRLEWCLPKGHPEGAETNAEAAAREIEEETGSLPENLPRGVAPEAAAANTDVQAIIAPRLTMLMEIANSFLLTIIDSLESVPYGIRWICKQIRSLTRVSNIALFLVCRTLKIRIAKIP